MYDSDDLFFGDADSFLDDTEMKTKVDFCKEIIEDGTIISNLEVLEDTVHLCLEYGFFEDGLLIVNAILDVTSYNSEMWQFRGIFLNNNFEFEEAYFSFEKAMALNPIDSETLLNKAVAEENLGLFDDAYESLKQALQIEPNNEDTHYSLGGLCEKKGEFEKAVKYFERAIELDEEFAEAWYELGVCYDTIEQFDKSLYAYDKYLEIEPYNHIGWFNRGVCLIEMSEFEKAIDSYELALAIQEDFPSAWFNLGVSHLSLKNYPLAIAAFKKIVKDNPKDDTAWFNLGSAFEEMNKFTEAIDAFTMSIEVDNEYYEAFLSRGFCYKKLNQSEKALRDFDRAMSILGHFEKEFEFGFSETEFETATDKYKILTNLKPDDFNAWNILGELYWKSGEYENSLSAYNNCLRIQPGNANAYYGKAKVNFLLHNVEEAINILKLAFNIDPNTKQKFENDYPAVKVSKLFNKLIDETSKPK